MFLVLLLLHVVFTISVLIAALSPTKIFVAGMKILRFA